MARRDQGPLGEFYRRKVKQLGHKRAVVALARKLLIVEWKLVLTGEVYRGADRELYERKVRRLKKAADLAGCILEEGTGYEIKGTGGSGCPWRRGVAATMGGSRIALAMRIMARASPP